jgi:hypothetical protein
VIEFDAGFIRIENDRLAAFDIGGRNTDANLAAVEAAEIDQAGEALLHWPRIVKTVKSKGSCRWDARMEMSGAPHQPRPDRAHPAMQMPPGTCRVSLDRRVVPERAQAFDPVGARIACDQRGGYRSGGRAG